MKKKPYLKVAFAIAFVLLVTEPVRAHHEHGLEPAVYADQSQLSEEKRLRSVVASVQTSKGQFASALYQPVMDLAVHQQRSGNHRAAIENFRRSQNLVHRHHGVYSERQIESLDLLNRSFGALGDVIAVDKLQHFRFAVAERAFGPGDIRLAASQLKLADWYRHTSRYSRAMEMYETSVSMIPSTDLAGHVRVLRSMALTEYLAGRCCGTERLAEAFELVETGDNSVGVELLQAATDLKDMAILEDKTIAMPVALEGLPSEYLGIADRDDILNLMGNVRTMRHTAFRGATYVDFGEREPGDAPVPTIGYPVAMCGNTYDSLVHGKSGPLRLDVKMTVSEQGIPKDITIDGDVPYKLKRYLKRSLIASSYRAATDETGAAVDAELTFTQYFDAPPADVTSRSQVQDWNRMLVAQACQVEGVQRI